jgi:hypothetical protein
LIVIDASAILGLLLGTDRSESLAERAIREEGGFPEVTLPPTECGIGGALPDGSSALMLFVRQSRRRNSPRRWRTVAARFALRVSCAMNALPL